MGAVDLKLSVIKPPPDLLPFSSDGDNPLQRNKGSAPAAAFNGPLLHLTGMIIFLFKKTNVTPPPPPSFCRSAHVNAHINRNPEEGFWFCS